VGHREKLDSTEKAKALSGLPVLYLRDTILNYFDLLKKLKDFGFVV
jgi:hypothetical protein